MMLSRSLILSLIVVIAVIIAACSDPEECAIADDCASGQICTAGVCEEEPSEEEEEEPSEEEEEEEEEPVCDLQTCSVDEFCIEGTCLPVTFFTETVATEDVGGWQVSLSLDSAGAPHLSFKDNGEESLLYAHRNDEGWDVQVADDSLSVGRDSRIAVDPEGYPHIIYNDGANWTAKYAVFDGQNWTTSTVIDLTGTGQEMDIAINDDGGVYLTLSNDLDFYDHRLTCLHRTTQGWEEEIVAGGGREEPWYNSLQIHDGIPHIAHFPQDLEYDDPRELRFARRLGTDDWVTESIPVDGARLGAYTPLGVGPDGHPQIAYHIRTEEDFSAGSLHLACFNGSEWDHILVDDRDAAGLYVDLAIDPWGRPHLIYGERNSATLRYARFHEGEWLHIDIADFGTEHLLGSWLPSIAIDARGIPHIAFHDPGTDSVRYATYLLD